MDERLSQVTGTTDRHASSVKQFTVVELAPLGHAPRSAFDGAGLENRLVVYRTVCFRVETAATRLCLRLLAARASGTRSTQ